MKSDLKKSAALIKKIKATLCAKDEASVLKDLETLNLSRYFEEISTSLIESKLKLSEASTATAVALSLNEKYADFLPSLLSRYSAIIRMKDPVFKADPREAQRVRRTTARIYLDLLAAGATADARPLSKYLAAAAGEPGKEGEPYAVTDAQGVVGFAKVAGPDVLHGVLPRHYAAQFASPSSSSLPPALGAPSDRVTDADTSKSLLAHLRGSLKTLERSMAETHVKLHSMNRRASKDRLLAGKLPEDREKGLADAKNLLAVLVKACGSLADSLGVEAKVLEVIVDGEEEEQRKGLEVRKTLEE